MKKAVYAGTFDPLTNGHLWVIEQTAHIFDEVVVAVGINPAKKTMFSTQERIEIITHATKSIPNVQVTSFENEYLARYAASINAEFIVRGIRDAQDFEYERTMRHINTTLEKSVMTVFLIPPKSLSEVSSSIVKGLIGPDGWEEAVEPFIPPASFAEILNHRYGIWKKLEDAGAKGSSQEFWIDIIQAYTQKTRAYHTLQHIGAMIHEFEKVLPYLSDPLAVELAIWFHDYYYDPLSKTNEEDSARHAQEVITSLSLPDSLGNNVADLILATKHASIPSTLDAQYLVDMDLAILGQKTSIFNRYEQAIRKEYEAIPFDVYSSARSKILVQFLERPAIYSTEYFAGMYEDTARKNVARSIENLRK